MQRKIAGIRRGVILLAVAAGLVGCGVSDQEAPSFIGPSGLTQSITLTATPDRLPRDGSSQAVVALAVRSHTGQPVVGQRFALASSTGTVSQTEVTTGADGRATFLITAPASSSLSAGTTIDVVATPISSTTGAQMAAARSLSIALLGPANTTAPTPGFTVNPEAPSLLQAVVFDASATEDEGVPCSDACTFTWDFGGEATGTGRVVTHQFRSVRVYPVALTVRDASGTTATLTRNVAVSQGTAPTATFTFSPASPGQFENVFFTAAASQPGVPGRTIVDYEWRFGDGTTAKGVTTSHAYNVLGTYPVVLTVTDSAGVQTTTTQTVTVINGLTAAFTFSPRNPTTGDSVVFDAEASQASSTGFGSRNVIVRYIWSFGDPNGPATVTESDRITRYRYSAARTYTVVLTVEDSAGRRATTSQTVTVVAP